MKLLKIIVLLLFSFKMHGQNNVNCDNIRKGIIDKNLYDILSNGKIIGRINLNKYKVFLIRNIKTEQFYYVTKPEMKRIKKCKCEGITIERLPKVGDKNTPKIVRD